MWTHHDPFSFSVCTCKWHNVSVWQSTVESGPNVVPMYFGEVYSNETKINTSSSSHFI